MQAISLIAGLLLGGLAAAAPSTQTTEAPTIVDHWVVSKVVRTHSEDLTNCNWDFHVSQSSVKNDVVCTFTVTAQAGKDCRVAPFANIECSGDSAFQVNAGHDDGGFIVLVLVNTFENALAYYGYDDAELDESPKKEINKQKQPATLIESKKTTSLGLAQRAEVLGTWTIENLFRFVDPSDNSIKMEFYLVEDGITCRLNLQPPTGMDAKTWAWSAQKCENNDYTVSWGFDEIHDAGIMTLVSPEKDRDAFFGWRDISKISYLGNAGPNPVYGCMCG
ncbi:uncharacterized protein BCR38DRAFT_519881 [Pseudomassariella vexata]|uniref:Uncharacterized protein n=1 Tax=Pseudomassariella vexata TaxID=1141098 RepID=A0A1Y2EKX4_9PEZI|nr:uncharacterized protein BCR38DRAFT_519881 [Pseudomassariella vexata]ORY71505.1 hypothetical protein BCR38DRAFT_519881 [Pseudomassariella vexata]